MGKVSALPGSSCLGLPCHLYVHARKAGGQVHVPVSVHDKSLAQTSLLHAQLLAYAFTMLRLLAAL